MRLRRAMAALAGALALGTTLWALAPRPLLTPRIERPVPPPADAPNVVLVVGCTVRADQTTPYGGPGNTTPFLDRLAREGTRFADPVAAAPWTKAAVTALLTGQHAISVGMVEPKAHGNIRALPAEVPTLGQRLHEAGWATLGYTANPNLNPEFGFALGFDHYDGTGALWRDGAVKREGTRMADEALSMLDRLGPGVSPFYLQAVFVDAHFPSELPADEIRPFRRRGLSATVSRYRAMLHRFDLALERLVVGLSERGYDEGNTLVVVVGDHGEGLELPDKRQGKSHGNYLFPSVVGVPFIAWGRGVARGHVVEGLVSGVDVADTVLGHVGLPLLEGPGRSWAAQLAGGARTERDRAFTDTWYKASSRAAVYTAERLCQDNFGKASKRFVPGCYERRDDLRYGEPIQDDPLMGELRAWRADAVEHKGKAANAELGPDMVRQLRALGYVE